MSLNPNKLDSIESFNQSFKEFKLTNIKTADILAKPKKYVSSLESFEPNKNNLSSYQTEKLNHDPNLIIIKKKPINKLNYTQTIAIRYLKPPTPPKPGDLIIRQEPDKIATPLTPIIIRQRPIEPKTPEPIVIREKPPKEPAEIPEKVITLPGKIVPANRQIILEKISAQPKKPPMIIIERWLPYPQQKRRIVYERINDPNPKKFEKNHSYFVSNSQNGSPLVIVKIENHYH